MKGLSFLILSCLIATTNVAQVADTIEWTVLLGGNKAGFSKKWKNPDGSFTEWFQFNDRGRGDSTVSSYRHDANGYLISIEAKGVDYFKKPIYEKYTLANGIARWENNSEKEEKKVDHKADYVPLKIPVGPSYRPYFRAAGNTIQHLPTGSSRLTVLKEHTLPDGKKVRLISTMGTGFTPSYAWLDENHEFFAYPGDWFAYMRKGHENLTDELYKIQKEYEERYFTDLAKKLTVKAGQGLAIVNAILFDPGSGTKTPHTTILVSGGRIQEVSASKVKIPSGYKVLDAQNKFVMPGLWDMHVHYGDATTGLLNLACGVTNVRDMGNGETLLQKKKEIDEGIALGPRIQVMSGFIDGAGPYAGPTGEKINSVDEGKAAIKKYADLGYQQIKLYSSIKPEWVKALTDEARKYNLRVSGHIPAHMTAEEAVLAGYDEIQHTNMLFLNFYGKNLDTRTPVRFTAVAEKAASFNFNSDEFAAFIKLLKERKTTIDPTVTIFEGMFTGREGKTDPSFESIAHRFPLTFQRNLKSNSGLAVPQGFEETYRNSYMSVLKMTRALYDHGVTIVPGTDGFPGFTLHRELENYAKAGIPNKEILKMATVTSAEVCRKSDLFGAVAKGKTADLIIIDGDPTQNMEDIRKVETIIKGEDIYQAKELLTAMSIKHYK
ncbi:MAG TPA: amidohydrolase family protein [Chryseosolibacter sp.]|nr:amidohydrolase family protein [Chryseosolibacter sp.]